MVSTGEEERTKETADFISFVVFLVLLKIKYRVFWKAKVLVLHVDPQKGSGFTYVLNIRSYHNF